MDRSADDNLIRDLRFLRTIAAEVREESRLVRERAREMVERSDDARRRLQTRAGRLRSVPHPPDDAPDPAELPPA